MKVKKGDILYQYHAYDISDKDYCNEELDKNNKRSCKDKDGNECVNYDKCNYRPKKSELEKVRITKLLKNRNGSVRMYRYVRINLKGYSPRGTIFDRSVNDWSKSNEAAFKKHNISLKKFIKKVEKSKQGDFYYFKKSELKTYQSLQKRVQNKIDKLKIKVK